MFYQLIVVFLVVSFRSSYSDDGEAYVETVSDESRGYVETSEDARSGRLLFSYRQNPVINVMLQTAAPNYVPKRSGDLFDFLRESYKLPGGECLLCVYLFNFSE